MNPVEIIAKKRDGKALTKDEIAFAVDGYLNKKFTDYQFSAFLMAVYLNGMNKKETSFLTETMLNSGKVIDLSSIKGKKIDKHSTGGVGDKTSLILAPIVAAAGVKVPMISGRGLGHSGGTLDKLESIPGFRTDLSLKEYKSVIKKVGAVIGQTKDIAPADKLIYSLRDVTATVESIPLITSSIMSKKLAEGIDGLVLDVKTGSGAFMKKTSEAITLAGSLINTAKSFNKKVIAFITDMNQPLGNYIGNWLEVYEVITVLQGGVKNDLTELSLKLSGAMIYLGGKSKSIDEGYKKAGEILRSGKAFDKFLEIVEAQGGDVNYINNPGKYKSSKYVQKIFAEKSGYISVVNNFNIGMAALELGAGRKNKEDKIDPKAGIFLNTKHGDKIKKGELIAELYSDSENKIDIGQDKINKAYKILAKKPKKQKLIKEIIS